MRILNAMKNQETKKHKVLMYTKVQVTGKKLNALIDIGASHLFISKLAVTKLRLQIDKTKT